MENKTDLSIIILSYNTCGLLADCLYSISKSEKEKYQIETIVVDNASVDESCKIVEEKFSSVTLIKNEVNTGFAAGNNLAIKKAKGRYLLFLNSDTIVPEKIFPELIEYLDNNEKAGALTVKLVLRNGKMDPDCHRGLPTPWASLTYFLGFEKLFPKSKIFGQYHQGFENFDLIHEVEALAGAFLMIKREVIKNVGVWDENYFFYGEDIDFCFRIRQKGWKIIYYPKISVIHLKGASSGLRKESKDISKANRETRLRTAKASIAAMEIFYNKFYKEKYPIIFTSIIIFGIKLKGWIRIVTKYLR